jgi:hypothetical protein
MTAFVAAVAIAVSFSPAVARPDAQVRVNVTGLHATSALVVLHGGIASRGKWFSWVPLQHAGGDSWTANLQTPGLYGIYPLRLRVGGAVMTTQATVEIVPPGFARQPGFDTPAQVAQWWAWIAQPGVALTSISVWNAGFFTHRDPSLNQLLRVEFNLLGNWPSLHLNRGKHVLYLSVARERIGAPWRLLQTVSAP